MKIKTLQLQNFKRFLDLTIDLGDEPKQIIALIGPNGCGKSSILEGIYHWFLTNGNIESQLCLYSDFCNYFNLFEPDQFNQHAPFLNLDKTGDAASKIIWDDPNFDLCSANATDQIRVYFRTDSNIQALLPATVNGDNFTLNLINSKDIDHRLEDNLLRLSLSDINLRNTVKSILNINHGTASISWVKFDTNEPVGNPKIQNFFIKDDYKFRYQDTPKDKPCDYSRYITAELLSDGEKAALDILLNLYINREHISNSILLLDEPELHLHTSLQRSLLQEISKYLGNNNQIWIATHSIGFMRALQSKFKKNCQVIELKDGTPWASSKQVLTPISLSSRNWQRIFKVALDDLYYLTLPDRIIICEGGDNSRSTSSQIGGLDEKVFNTIFGGEYPDTMFISVGSCSNMHDYLQNLQKLIKSVFPTTRRATSRSVSLMSLSDGDANPETSHLYPTEQQAKNQDQDKKSKQSVRSKTTQLPANISPLMLNIDSRLNELRKKVKQAITAPESLNVGEFMDETNKMLELISKVNRPQENLQHRYLARRELENYLFDPEVIQAFADANGFFFSEEGYNKLITTYYENYCSLLSLCKHQPDPELAPVKVVQIKDNAMEILSNTLKLSESAPASTELSTAAKLVLDIQRLFVEAKEPKPTNCKELYDLKLHLAKYIKSEMAVYKEIKQCIFGADKEQPSQSTNSSATSTNSQADASATDSDQNR